jgi:hypothetical protein
LSARASEEYLRHGFFYLLESLPSVTEAWFIAHRAEKPELIAHEQIDLALERHSDNGDKHVIKKCRKPCPDKMACT